ncbi:hypothetical protein B8W70_05555 [Pseudomonas sp. 1239]|jgi:hypothetical protein|uniref:hypothetical protein n=1 Tax=Pseudomonas TaxID=286 RepID=UPI000996C71D|nr:MULTISPECIES: hypothetical protein [Pseudomonas]MBG8561840.1 hypothetical protein [Pseudomonas qingdaonensis]MCS5514887.1 hypothetical protein [Pseudomonas qingdaonensis]OOW05413.1 hypothetical protein MF6396_06070 [Pseudomonas sp. MF6396]OUM33230.1 hypothetical protein B8W70_05555 [Pseudomonas sp. 1239]UVL51804.1 hypothetical protein LOY33_02550 [Pseudomonas sp. B21-036]
MNLARTLALSSALLLGGCGDETFMSVRFQTDVGTARWGLDPINLQMIGEALEQRQVDPKRLRFDVDAEDKRLVHVVLLQPLDEQQQAALRGLFEDIVQARNAVTFAIEVTLQPTAAERQRLTPSQLQALEAMPASFTLPAEPGDEVSTVAAMPEQWPGTTMDVNEQVQAEVSCLLYISPRQYYPGMTDVYAAKGDDPQRVVLEFAETGEANAFSLWKVSARYRFKQASLQQQVDKGELALLPADEQNRKSLSIAFKLADLGEHELMRAYQIDYRVKALNSQCYAEQMKLGRPYTFFMGAGLDRVEAVTYPQK